MEMKRISHFDVLEHAPMGSSHERVFEVTANLQLEADKQVMEELFAELEKLFIPAYNEGELGVKPPTDWLITISQWQSLKKKYLGEK